MPAAGRHRDLRETCPRQAASLKRSAICKQQKAVGCRLIGIMIKKYQYFYIYRLTNDRSASKLSLVDKKISIQKEKKDFYSRKSAGDIPQGSERSGRFRTGKIDLNLPSRVDNTRSAFVLTLSDGGGFLSPDPKPAAGHPHLASCILHLASCISHLAS